MPSTKHEYMTVINETQVLLYLYHKLNLQSTENIKYNNKHFTCFAAGAI